MLAARESVRLLSERTVPRARLVYLSAVGVAPTVLESFFGIYRNSLHRVGVQADYRYEAQFSGSRR